jgi:hypothetical protein
MYEQIPLSVLEQFAGQWIVWDEDARAVVGSGETLDEAEDEAAKAPATHLLRIHHVLPRGTEIAGQPS